jgi:hypothetical protein
MKDNKLISMVEFVMIYTSKHESTSYVDMLEIYGHCFNLIKNYAQFLSQPLTLGMFVPCVDGEPMRKPYKMYSSGLAFSSRKLTKDGHAYKQAKSRVLFEGFDIKHSESSILVGLKGELICSYSKRNREDSFFSIPDVEQLLDYGSPTLTETALKQIR